MSALAAVSDKKASAPRYTWQVPKAARLFETDPESITLTPLTFEQDTHGNKLVASSGNIYDKIKLCVTAIDGKPVDWAGGATDKIVDSMSPPVRELLARAFTKLHLPSDEDEKDFFASVQVDV
jgi:hypothetical protein